MIFKTRKDAYIHLACTFTKTITDLHSIVRATINGRKVGWMLVLDTSNHKKF